MPSISSSTLAQWFSALSLSHLALSGSISLPPSVSSSGTKSLSQSCFRTISSISSVTVAPPYWSRMSQCLSGQGKPSLYSALSSLVNFSYSSQALMPSCTNLSCSSTSKSVFSVRPLGASAFGMKGGAPTSSSSTSLMGGGGCGPRRPGSARSGAQKGFAGVSAISRLCRYGVRRAFASARAVRCVLRAGTGGEQALRSLRGSCCAAQLTQPSFVMLAPRWAARARSQLRGRCLEAMAVPS
mmetsp:Transcript_19676/g.58541  ORF Transcript_19676/g.58541 Transcript_19676/m.58541 type:complete len:241 (+) Transcript_19676:602-1324(+)